MNLIMALLFAFLPNDYSPAAVVYHMCRVEMALYAAFREISCLGGAPTFVGMDCMLRMVMLDN